MDNPKVEEGSPVTTEEIHMENPGSSEDIYYSATQMEEFPPLALIEGNGEENSSKCKKLIKRSLSWKPKSYMSQLFIYILLPVIIWILCFLLIGPTTLPGGSIFPIFILEFSGLALGALVGTVKLPPLVGMLIAGIMLRNVPLIDFGKDVSPLVSSPLRQIALVIILIRAGLGLDAGALMKLKGVVLRLAFLPCIFEALTIGIASHFILDFPWAWGFLLGFVIAAVSPAVVVPCLLSLSEKGYGTNKGIPTIVIAAASVDDILAISMFGVCLGFAFSRGTILESLIQGPLELIFGISFGIVWGIILGVFLAENPKSRIANLTRSFFVLSGGLLSVFGFQYMEYPGAGALGCLCSTFIGATIWRRKKILNDKDAVSWCFAILWLIFQPLLFGLIGCEIDFSSIDGDIVLRSILCLFIGLVIRLAISVLATSHGSLTWQEKIFVAIAWLPKATVQAAIGPVALDAARRLDNSFDLEELGYKVLTVAILSILLTAPTGALAITIFGPKLLAKS